MQKHMGAGKELVDRENVGCLQAKNQHIPNIFPTFLPHIVNKVPISTFQPHFPQRIIFSEFCQRGGGSLFFKTSNFIII